MDTSTLISLIALNDTANAVQSTQSTTDDIVFLCAFVFPILLIAAFEFIKWRRSR